MEASCKTFRDRIVELRRVPARELIANPRNWRRHPARQAAALRGVLEEVGYADALLARETPEGLMLIDGHLRAETTPDQEVPVLVLDVDEAEANKLLATLDPLAGMAEIDKLAFKDLAGLIQTDSAEVRELLQGLAGFGREAQQDAIPALPVTPVARLGQMWRLGKHRLLCGDSTRPECVSRIMAAERAILFQTDPPYAIGYTGGSHPVTRKNRGKANRNKDWSGSYREAAPSPDIENSEALGRDFYLKFIRAAVDTAIAPNAAWYCWHASNRQAMLESVWNELGAFMHQQIIWFKSRPVLTYSIYMWAHEPCLFGWIKGQKPRVDRNQDGGYPATVWEVPNAEVESNEHPTSKPNRLFAIPMLLHTSANDLCYEPFCGSGSQLIAAEQLGRRCYAIELEPRFIDVAISRWERLTGKKAELIEGGNEHETRTAAQADPAKTVARKSRQAAAKPPRAAAARSDSKLPQTSKRSGAQGVAAHHARAQRRGTHN
jgi:DNA modification methylase